MGKLARSVAVGICQTKDKPPKSFLLETKKMRTAFYIHQKRLRISHVLIFKKSIALSLQYFQSVIRHLRMTNYRLQTYKFFQYVVSKKKYFFYIQKKILLTL